MHDCGGHVWRGVLEALSLSYLEGMATVDLLGGFLVDGCAVWLLHRTRRSVGVCFPQARGRSKVRCCEGLFCLLVTKGGLQMTGWLG